MGYTRLLQLSATGLACAIALLAADFWKTKDSSQWSSEEVNKLLSDSPWAKDINIAPQQSGQRRGNGTGRRGGGFGFPGGIGYPGGGGGGGGYPGGDDSGNYPGGRNEPMNITVRWESALPVQQALTRQGGIAAD